LTVGGKTYSQPITVRTDPRVQTPAAVLGLIASWSQQLYQGALESQPASQQLQAIREQIKSLQQKAAGGAAAEALADFDRKAQALQGSGAAGGAGGRGGRGGGGGRGAGAGGGSQNTLSAIGGSLSALIGPLQAADAMPPAHVVESVNERLQALAAVMSRWSELRTGDLAALNVQLKQAGLPPVEIK
jgi:hypothetical protein